MRKSAVCVCVCVCACVCVCGKAHLFNRRQVLHQEAFQKSFAKGIELNLFLTAGVKIVILYFVNNMINTPSQKVWHLMLFTFSDEVIEWTTARPDASRGIMLNQLSIEQLVFGSKRDKVLRGWRNCMMRRFVNYIFQQGNQIEGKEKGGVGSRYGGKQSCRQSFGGEKRREKICRKT